LWNVQAVARARENNINVTKACFVYEVVFIATTGTAGDGYALLEQS
jgi:hypothetical protein